MCLSLSHRVKSVSDWFVLQLSREETDVRRSVVLRSTGAVHCSTISITPPSTQLYAYFYVGQIFYDTRSAEQVRTRYVVLVVLNIYNAYCIV